jgi:hypothetical protein
VDIYSVCQKEMPIFREVIRLVIQGKKVYMYMYPILDCFRDRAIPVYSSKTVDKKEILRTASNTDSYCSSDKVSTVYLVQYTFENSTVNLSALCSSCEGGHGVLLVWVHLAVPLCVQWHPLCDRAVRLVYPLFSSTLLYCFPVFMRARYFYVFVFLLVVK